MGQRRRVRGSPGGGASGLRYPAHRLLLGAVRERKGNTPGALDAFRGFVERVRRDDPRRAPVEAVLAQYPG